MGIKGLTESAKPALLKALGAHEGALATPLAAKAAMALDHVGLDQLDRSVTQEVSRLNAGILARSPELLKTKYQLMAESPFSFFRGTDGLFYRDLKAIEGSGLDRGARTVLQGDLHVANFGTMTRPKGKVFVGPNDFDEAFVGPANLDLKRFGTSVVLAAQQAGFHPAQTREFVADAAKAYRHTLKDLVDHPASLQDLKQPSLVKDLIERAENVDPQKWLDTKTVVRDGQRMLERSDTVASVSDQTAADVKKAFERYRKAMPKDVADQLAPYQITDVASAISGTGSVGRGRYRFLLEAKHEPPMIMEAKEEVPSAMAPFVAAPAPVASEADRYLMTSHTMDGKLDPFLGKTTMPKRDALQSTSFLVRRVSPTKDAIDPTAITDAEDFGKLMNYYAKAIAVGHANGQQVGLAGAAEVLESLGPKDAFTSDLVDFSHRYAQQVTRDHRAFSAALAKDPLLRQP